jgi:hypothetical protein
MANRLKMAIIETIITLRRRGWSKRRIARELGLDRATVAGHLRTAANDSKPAIAPTGSDAVEAGSKPAIAPTGSSMAPEDSKPAIAPTGSTESAGEFATVAEQADSPIPESVPIERRGVGRPSDCAPYGAVIAAAWERDLSAQRIYQDLVCDHGFTGSYYSVRRFVRRLGRRAELPVRPIVIGRSESGIPEYLDPAYRTTRLVPGTGQAVVQSDSAGSDVYVSRGHFMLRGDSRGIVLTDGVPRLGGGIRPPRNRTWLWGTDWRLMDPGEEFLIEHGASVALRLPNGTVVQICAE